MRGRFQATAPVSPPPLPLPGWEQLANGKGLSLPRHPHAESSARGQPRSPPPCPAAIPSQLRDVSIGWLGARNMQPPAARGPRHGRAGDGPAPPCMHTRCWHGNRPAWHAPQAALPAAPAAAPASHPPSPPCQLLERVATSTSKEPRLRRERSSHAGPSREPRDASPKNAAPPD